MPLESISCTVHSLQLHGNRLSHLIPNGPPLKNSESEDGVRARWLCIHVGGGHCARECSSPQTLAGLQGTQHWLGEQHFPQEHKKQLRGTLGMRMEYICFKEETPQADQKNKDGYIELLSTTATHCAFYVLHHALSWSGLFVSPSANWYRIF